MTSDSADHPVGIRRDYSPEDVQRLAGSVRIRYTLAEMAALLLRRQLVLEMHARRARLDIGLHDLESVKRAAEARLGVGHDRREPVHAVASLRRG